MITSRQIAEKTGKKHPHVKRDIRALTGVIDGFTPVEREYIDVQNRPQVELVLDDASADVLLARYEGMARMPLTIQERIALTTIEQVLGVSLKRQFSVGRYRIDGYDEHNRVAYEIDGPEHRFSAEKDALRQAEIEHRLGCKFVRVTL